MYTGGWQQLIKGHLQSVCTRHKRVPVPDPKEAFVHCNHGPVAGAVAGNVANHVVCAVIAVALAACTHSCPLAMLHLARLPFT